MPTTPAKPVAEVSAEHMLFAMLAASLTLVGTIAAAALLPEALGVTVALVVLLAGRRLRAQPPSRPGAGRARRRVLTAHAGLCTRSSTSRPAAWSWAM
jgi:hypothetical protein